MKNYNKNIGFYGEDIAVEYIKKKGYFVLDRNFRNRYGEIDIISSFKDVIIFIEVKSRYSNSCGTPIESVTYFKQKKIFNLCKFYLLNKKLFNYNCRFDVIEIYFNTSNDLYKINHIEDAFRGY
jgi:putative endonuclease